MHLTFTTQLNLLIQRFPDSFCWCFRKAQLKEGENSERPFKTVVLISFSTSSEPAHLHAGAHMTMSFVSVFMAAKRWTEFYRNGSLFLPPRPRGLRSLAFIVLFSPLLLIYNRLFSDSECFLSLNYSPVFCAQTVINCPCWCFAIVPRLLMRLFLFRGFYGGNSSRV